MKKIFLSAVAFLALTSQVNAFVPQMEYILHADYAAIRVWNNTPGMIVCSGRAFGRTWQGSVAYTWANQITLQPNMYMDIYVAANWGDPMVQAWAEMNCESVWW